MIKCPVCHQLLEQLTTVHCQNEHGLNKQQVIKQYGKPESMYKEFSTRELNSSAFISQRDYLDSQQFTARFRSKNRKFHCDR